MTETFTLTIELGNDAMTTRVDLGGALHAVARRIESTLNEEGIIRDLNGNRVGRWELYLPEQTS